MREGEIDVWMDGTVDMRCLLVSYAVSFHVGTILLEAEQPSCKVLLIEAALLGRAVLP